LKNSEIILEDFSWRCRGVVVVVFVGVVVCKGRVFPVGGGRITFLRIPELRSHDDFCVEDKVWRCIASSDCARAEQYR